MNINKKFICLLFVIFLIGCDGMDGACYNEADYGNSGDYDTIVVTPGHNLCSYDVVDSFNSLNQSDTVRSCLNDTLISNLTNSSLSSYDDKFASSSVKSSIKCSDVADGDYQSSYFKENIGQEDKMNIATAYFNECVTTCVNKCESEGGNGKGEWVHANIKTSGKYIGINLEKETQISIRASGAIALTDQSDSPEVSFNKFGKFDVSKDDYLKNGDIAEIIFKINRDYSTGKEFNNDINNFKARTYFGFKAYNTALSHSGTGYSLHKFQEPDYRAVSCEYKNDEAVCSFKYENIIDANSSDNSIYDFISNLNRYYSLNYQTAVFGTKEYFKYASSKFNDIGYNTTSQVIEIYDQELYDSLTVEDKTNLTKTFTLLNNSWVEGYVWNDENSIYNFTVSGPFKLAIKYLGTNDISCKYTITYEDIVLTESTNNEKEATSKDIELSVNYDNINDKTGSKYNWKTIKNRIDSTDSSDSEYIFNRFSTLSKPISKRITIKKILITDFVLGVLLLRL